MTVNRARATVSDVTVKERTGLDGKTRRMPIRPEMEVSEERQQTRGGLTIYALEAADLGRRFSGFFQEFTGNITKELRAAVTDASNIWAALAEQMEEGK
jgi:hypothetical protein